LASGLVETFDRFFLLDMYVFEKWDLLFDRGRAQSFYGETAFVGL
jgi:hypothetical protein